MFLEDFLRRQAASFRKKRSTAAGIPDYMECLALLRLHGTEQCGGLSRCRFIVRASLKMLKAPATSSSPINSVEDLVESLHESVHLKLGDEKPKFVGVSFESPP